MFIPMKQSSVYDKLLRWFCGILTILVLGITLTNAQTDQDQPVSRKSFVEKLTLISRVPENFSVYFESFASDEALSEIAYVAIGEMGMRVVDNKEIGPVYDHIAKDYPVLAPYTDKIGYLADKEGSHYAVIDGRESPPYDSVCCLRFSPNGQYSAYLAQKENEQFVVLNGHALRKYDMIDQQTGVLFSPDSNHAAYIAVNDSRQRVVHNGQEYPPFDNITEIGFSPDSSELAYIAVKDKNYYLIRGKKSYGPFDIVQNLVWSPDGKHLAAVAFKNDRWIIIKDDQKITAGQYVINTYFDKKTSQYQTATPRLTPPVFSPDSSRFAYVKTDGVRYQMIIDGKAGPAFDRISRARFSPDSAHYSYIASTQDSNGPKSWVILDGEPGNAYEKVDTPVFSPDFQHMAYRAQKNNKWCVVTGTNEGPFFDEVGIPLFSPDFQHLAYRARNNDKWCVVSDNKQGAFYDEVAPPFFSPDSSSLVYRAKKNEKYCIVKNEEEHPFYDEISHLDFSQDSSQMVYRAQKGDAWLIVRNGREGRPYKIVPPKIFHPISNPFLSPQGNHLIYTARTAATIKKTKIVVDGQEGDLRFLFLPHVPFIWNSENHCHTMVGQYEQEQLRIYRLDITITE